MKSSIKRILFKEFEYRYLYLKLICYIIMLIETLVIFSSTLVEIKIDYDYEKIIERDKIVNTILTEIDPFAKEIDEKIILCRKVIKSKRKYDEETLSLLTIDSGDIAKYSTMKTSGELKSIKIKELLRNIE